MRITITDLRNVVRRMNRILTAESQGKTYLPDDANVTEYFTISCAYGGYQLCNSDGSRNVLNTGHIKARDAYEIWHAYCNAMETAFNAIDCLPDNQHKGSAFAALVAAYGSK